MEQSNHIRKIALVGNHLPRRCGIATFTRDLANAIRGEGIQVDVVAMSDRHGYRYPAPVIFEIAQDSPAAYAKAAAKLNSGGYDLVCVQHEYGIYGGPAGAYLLKLLRELKIPIVTTLHTVLQHPTPEQRVVIEEIIGLSQQLIVMSEKAVDLLNQAHKVPKEKISVIPHGIPDLPAESAEKLKESVGLKGQNVLLTLGLLSPDKGVEYVIEALPSVPNVTYVVLGQTHPHIRRHSGEQYRNSLIELAKKLGVENRVKFFNRFVDQDELARFVKLADINITPYLKVEQITSGTLAYAVGNGKAVISTPYWHAEELLDGDRGLLVPMRDAGAIAEAVNNLLNDTVLRAFVQENAFEYGKSMRWPVVAEEYVRSFDRACSENGDLLRSITIDEPLTLERTTTPVPAISHLVRLTDDTGILQHATYTVPNRKEGYCLDDNARALLTTVLLQEAGMNTAEVGLLQSCYVSFCAHAINSSGRFRNFMSYDRNWLEKAGSEDSNARAIWCLGVASVRAHDPGVRRMARELVHRATFSASHFNCLRAWAYSVLGFVAMGSLDEVSRHLKRLKMAYSDAATKSWYWFEPQLSYANARLPQALLLGGKALNDEDAIDIGLRSLSWLCEQQTENGVFAPIGSDGFYPKGGQKARFDQQPIEACAQVSACLSAFEITRDSRWRREADRAFAWFLGENLLKVDLADVQTGGCRDGLTPFGANENQGAESTVSYLCSLLELRAVCLVNPRGQLL